MVAGAKQPKTVSNMIELWNHCENPYPVCAERGAGAGRLGAGQPPQ